MSWFVSIWIIYGHSWAQLFKLCIHLWKLRGELVCVRMEVTVEGRFPVGVAWAASFASSRVSGRISGTGETPCERSEPTEKLIPHEDSSWFSVTPAETAQSESLIGARFSHEEIEDETAESVTSEVPIALHKPSPTTSYQLLLAQALFLKIAHVKYSVQNYFKIPDNKINRRSSEGSSVYKKLH